MADHQEARVTLPSEPVSVSAARRYVARVLTDWGLPEDAEAADALRLILSELATNAVLHTFGQSPTFTVDLLLEREELLSLGVTDSHPRRPQRLPAAVQQDNGRGMVIVRALAKEYGGRVTVTPTDDGGKTVWVTLPWHAPAGPDAVRTRPAGPRQATRP
ncbi:ATP-binding protein [Streptomyces sp. NBC_00525]|uniref:ATP-binding protein n=1 Tax=Streptomyces sp. NBC_00525 TaxID=2903660 RepID=UPI002E820253|nr:ATP-binding protein [Streptomyces sp. NBC_00525]WUC92553.1 ATP-binding protein [Streptomyces sp. NBC_00525]